MCSILLVEDHFDTRRAFAGLLGSWGHHVSTSDSAAGGLAFLNGNNVDVILSDIGLPDQNGYDFISQVRQKDSRVIAIAVSAYFTAADQQRGHEAGFDMYFAKPVDLMDLRFALARVSAQRGREAEEAGETPNSSCQAGEAELGYAN
jgi:two-component system CheB/CheR fusion protein